MSFSSPRPKDPAHPVSQFSLTQTEVIWEVVERQGDPARVLFLPLQTKADVAVGELRLRIKKQADESWSATLTQRQLSGEEVESRWSTGGEVRDRVSVEVGIQVL